jgi:hypothetical protein
MKSLKRELYRFTVQFMMWSHEEKSVSAKKVLGPWNSSSYSAFNTYGTVEFNWIDVYARGCAGTSWNVC